MDANSLREAAGFLDRGRDNARRRVSQATERTLNMAGQFHQPQPSQWMVSLEHSRALLDGECLTPDGEEEDDEDDFVSIPRPYEDSRREILLQSERDDEHTSNTSEENADAEGSWAGYSSSCYDSDSDDDGRPRDSGDGLLPPPPEAPGGEDTSHTASRSSEPIRLSALASHPAFLPLLLQHGTESRLRRTRRTRSPSHSPQQEDADAQGTDYARHSPSGPATPMTLTYFQYAAWSNSTYAQVVAKCLAIVEAVWRRVYGGNDGNATREDLIPIEEEYVEAP
ncbi:hypothetical protein BU26DRAFT_509778 [Trematosphaeria pertusa]|uniref:Uncharacterized protein n=1 Tax=Trematosphaeria pertusa TaxID=390896 RepID=A0A6A6I010_9PLEO|nr:uncharacterized protein BU26DRAFT_509778 [Trematosphaeria pertusa]KAF2243223.1 hypothetical protein BU26DRAFT_509778 [Trematosphaeria pertusa]